MTYPQRNNEVVKIASIFTQLKSLFISISILLIVVGVLALLFKKLKLKIQTKQVE